MVAQHSRKKKVALGVIITLVCVVVAVLIGFNLYIRIAYSSFYSKAQEEFAIPGVNNGFICQDLDYYDEGDCWLFSGYSSSEGPSPLYRRDANGETVKFTAELPDGAPYEGHGSGITTSENFAFLTCDEGYLVFDVAALAQAGEGESVRAIDKVDLEITPAFINIENDALYTGTFHLEPNYAAPEEHHLTTPDGSENAACSLSILVTRQRATATPSRPRVSIRCLIKCRACANCPMAISCSRPLMVLRVLICSPIVR